MKTRDDSLLGTGTKTCICDACGQAFSSPTSFSLHQNWTYGPIRATLKCATTPEELEKLGLVLGKRGRYSIDPEGEVPWWDRVKEANAKFEDDEE